MEIKVYRKITKVERGGHLIMGIALIACSTYGYIKYDSWFLAVLLFLAGILISYKFFVKKEYDEEIISDIDKFEVIKKRKDKK